MLFGLPIRDVWSSHIFMMGSPSQSCGHTISLVDFPRLLYWSSQYLYGMPMHSNHIVSLAYMVLVYFYYYLLLYGTTNL